MPGFQPAEAAVYEKLTSLKIPFERLSHDPVYTMEDCLKIEEAFHAPMCKNLFLCNRQETDFYLLLLPAGKPFVTKDVSRELGVSRLSFGKDGPLERLLHIRPGAVSPMGLCFESAAGVRLLIDGVLLEEEKLVCHPCVNTASIMLSMRDFLNLFLPGVSHSFTAVHL